jgi:hypothetical protein
LGANERLTLARLIRTGVGYVADRIRRPHGMGNRRTLMCMATSSKGQETVMLGTETDVPFCGSCQKRMELMFREPCRTFFSEEHKLLLAEFHCDCGRTIILPQQSARPDQAEAR